MARLKTSSCQNGRSQGGRRALGDWQPTATMHRIQKETGPGRKKALSLERCHQAVGKCLLVWSSRVGIVPAWHLSWGVSWAVHTDS